MAQNFTLPDGRVTDYLISGAKEGPTLIWIHGTPGAYVPPYGLPEGCEAKGVRLVTYSRPGYGGSTRRQGAKIVDAVEDIEALKQHLGIKECFIGGWSGGGPAVLACAARLSGCLATLCIAGVAPYDAEGLDWLEGQGEDNVKETEAALAGEAELQKHCMGEREGMLQATPENITEALASLLPEVDVRALKEHPGLSEEVVVSFKEALKSSADGWVDDSLAFISPWGFDLSEVKTKVILYQGTDDKMVPFGHGKWFAEHLPQHVLSKHLLEGEGHISIFLGRVDAMLDELKSVL